jgi:hypothetical protein
VAVSLIGGPGSTTGRLPSGWGTSTSIWNHDPLLFQDEILETLAMSIQSRLVTGSMREVLGSLATTLINEPWLA